jgi:hypothetical protein
LLDNYCQYSLKCFCLQNNIDILFLQETHVSNLKKVNELNDYFDMYKCKKVSKILIIVSLNVYPKIQYKINHVRQTCQKKHLNNIQKNSTLLTNETNKKIQMQRK